MGGGEVREGMDIKERWMSVVVNKTTLYSKVLLAIYNLAVFIFYMLFDGIYYSPNMYTQPL